MSRAEETPTAEKRWIHRDNIRGWVAAGIALPVSMALFVAIVLLRDRQLDQLTGTFIYWDVFGVVYAVLTLVAFRTAQPAALPALLRREASQRSRLKRYLLGGGDGPGFAVSLAVVALAGAALLPRLEVLTGRGNETVLAAALIVAVVVSWFVVVLSYTVHYARKDAENPGLRFPREAPGFLAVPPARYGTNPQLGRWDGEDGLHGWTDYFYFSLTVATTFGATDVDVMTTRMRRTVTGHAALAFLFNTVIIALLVTALTR